MFAARASLVVLGAALLEVGGCGNDEGSLVGMWTGGFRDDLGGLGGGSFTFTEQSGAELRGSWQMFFQLTGISAGFNNSGSLAATVEGDEVAGVLTSQGPCPFSFQARVSGRTMAGTYTTGADCSAPEAGSFDLERR